MEHKSSTTFLKVMSILMIIGGCFEVVAALFSLGTIGILAIADVNSGILYFSSALIIAAAVVYLVAGIVGMKACKVQKNIKKCLVWGIISIILLLLGNVVNGVWGSGFQVQNLLIGLILPGLYIFSAIRLQRNSSIE